MNSQKTNLLNSLRSQNFPKQILNAFSSVKRENFIPREFSHLSYEDMALPIGHNQTISQPYTIATMLNLLDLRKSQKVLEVGSGCGYVLALINEITGKEVYGLEIIKELYETSKQNLKDYPHALVFNKPGSLGLEEFAPFDRIIISCSIKKIPPALTRQLKQSGLLVAPIESGKPYQTLTLFQKQKDRLKTIKEIPGFSFVRFVENRLA